jgi:hypothetical protein
VAEASCQNIFHKPTLGKRRSLVRYGEKKTVTRGDSDDLGTFATLGRAKAKPPAIAKIASTNASSRWSLPRSCRYLANRRGGSTNLPSPTHC